eukprot:14800915-Alexandrium_andersonii.AAC.1
MKRPGVDKPHMKRARRPQPQPNLRPTTGQYDGKLRGSANHVYQEPTLRDHTRATSGTNVPQLRTTEC